MNKITISTQKLLMLLLIYISFENSTIFSKFNRYVAMLFAVLAVFFLIEKKIAIVRRFDSLHWLMIGILGFSLFNILMSDTVMKSGYFGIMLFSTMLITVIDWSQDNIDFYLKWIERLTFVFCLSIYLNWFVKGLMTNYLSPLVVSGSRSVLVSEIAAGEYSGFLAERSNSAVAAAMGIGFSFSNMLANRIDRKRNLIGLVFYFGALILTGKRAPIFFAVLACICVLIISRYPKKNARLPFIIFTGAIAGYLTFIYFPPVQNIIKRSTTLINNNMLLNGRDVLWEVAIDMYKQSPIIGTGLNSFNTHFNIYGVWGNNWGSQGHNTYVQLLGETGIVGLVLFAFLFVAALSISIKISKRVSTNNAQKINEIVIYALYYQFFWLGYGVSGNPFYYLGQRVTYFMAIALILYVKRILDSNEMLKVKNRNI